MKGIYEARYIIYKPDSNYKIGFVIDQIPYSPRRSAVENKWETICKRNLCKLESEEMDSNKDYNIRRFKVWFYRDIESLIIEDLKYNVKTPEEFINHCKKLGYVQKNNKNQQLQLF